MNLTVACVEWGNYLGRGGEYIDKLQAGVARHLKAEHSFTVIRPEGEPLHPGLVPLTPKERTAGTWQKLAMFRPGRFKGRVLYLDLDSVITGPLDPLVAQCGAVHLKHWGWDRNVHAGGCLVWDHGEFSDRIWRAFHSGVAQKFVNDQEWMTGLNCWPALPAHLVRSYRYHCKQGVPDLCSIVAFHGRPKPHELPADDWIHDHWKL
jgi:hypothetical protein